MMRLINALEASDVSPRWVLIQLYDCRSRRRVRSLVERTRESNELNPDFPLYLNKCDSRSHDWTNWMQQRSTIGIFFANRGGSTVPFTSTSRTWKNVVGRRIRNNNDRERRGRCIIFLNILIYKSLKRNKSKWGLKRWVRSKIHRGRGANDVINRLSLTIESATCSVIHHDKCNAQIISCVLAVPPIGNSETFNS